MRYSRDTFVHASQVSVALQNQRVFIGMTSEWVPRSFMFYLRRSERSKLLRPFYTSQFYVPTNELVMSLD
jgi:hypothetical protein